MGYTCLFFISLVIASLPYASPRANLLLILLDQWRFDWAGFNDPAVRLPNLANIASKGTRFTHAFTPSPICAPARGSLGAGMEYDESPVPDNMIDYDTTVPTYYSQLGKVGYHVMMAGKDHMTMLSGVGVNGSIHAKACGFHDWLRMPDKYEVFLRGKPYDQWSENLQEHELFQAVSECYGPFGMGICCDNVSGVEPGGFCPRTQPAGKASVVYPDDWTEASAEVLLDRKPAGKPWFMQVGFPGPHPPFILTESMNKSVEGRTYPLPHGSQETFDNEFYQVMRRQYAAEIENIDALIGKLVAKLQASGEYNNTIIAVSADHGEMLGDYNRYGKSLPWDGSARVPLLFMGPGVKAGSEVSKPVSTLDIVGTFLELGGAETAANMTTRSLWPLLLTGGAGGRYYIRSGLGGPTYRGEEHDNVDHLTFSAEIPPHPPIVNWRMVVMQMNTTSTLKLVCCPSGCNSINGNNSLLPSSSSAQVGLFEISGPNLRLEVDLLSRGFGKKEASELVKYLPSTYRKACEPLVTDHKQEIYI